ncbi:hypothetical protein [Moraxella lacunata]|uniref:hypothetical protein n=1 Tax=Moraxella lacunata TaxID=477 RepID=UPI003EE10ABB
MGKLYRCFYVLVFYLILKISKINTVRIVIKASVTSSWEYSCLKIPRQPQGVIGV